MLPTHFSRFPDRSFAFYSGWDAKSETFLIGSINMQDGRWEVLVTYFPGLGTSMHGYLSIQVNAAFWWRAYKRLGDRVGVFVTRTRSLWCIQERELHQPHHRRFNVSRSGVALWHSRIVRLRHIRRRTPKITVGLVDHLIFFSLGFSISAGSACSCLHLSGSR